MCETKVMCENYAHRTSPYPCVKIDSTNGDRIVLFTAANEGVLISADLYWEPGRESREWNESRFQPFSGTLTYSNSGHDYPCVKISKSTGTVVLFTGPKEGVIIVKDRGGELGTVSNDWAESAFRVFNGTVEFVCTTQQSAKAVEAPTYPQTRIADDGMVVLFTGPTSGVLLKPGKHGTLPVGHVSDCWDTRCFKPFKGSLVF